MAGNTINQKGLIWPKKKLLLSRRSLLKAAPLILAGAALAAMPKSAEAFFMKGGEAHTVLHPNPPQPSPAATWGFGNLSFFDDFASSSTIDVNNTLAPGFNWYARYLQTNSITTVIPSSGIQVSGSVLTLTPPSTGGWLTTMGCSGNRPNVSLVGTPQQTSGGAYYQCRMAFDSSLKNNPWWPAFFSFDNQLTLALTNNLAFRANGYAELDFMEAIWIGFGNPNIQMADWTWYSASAQTRNTNNVPTISVPTTIDGLFHDYGLLHVPQALNGGTGLIQRFFDGVHKTECDVTYTSGGISPQENGSIVGWMSCLENTPIGTALQIGSGNGWTIHVDSVQVWKP